MRVLLVEDTAKLAALIAAGLAAEGMLVDTVGSVAEAAAAAAVATYDVAVLDRRLPDGDGISLIPLLRAKASPPRVLVLTALDAVPDRVDGLEAGADDYLVKPFALPELVARLRALARRDAPEERLCCGRLVMLPAAREATVDGAPLRLQRRDLALAETLLRRAGRVVPREALMDQVWSLDEAVQPNALETCISRLRRRLEAAGAGVRIEPVRGVGYIMTAERTDA